MSEPREVEGFRLSPQQERLWELQEGATAGPYRATAVVEVRGSFGAEEAAAALRWVVRRHEILRTGFQLLPGLALPVQVIAEEVGLRLEERDFRVLPPEEAEARCAELLGTLAAAVEDLAAPPLLAAARVTLAADHHRLLLALPALCADAVTLARLVDEIARGYAALHGGVEAGEEPVQYVDVAEWQRHVLAAPEGAEGRRLWRRAPLFKSLDAELPFAPWEGAAFAPESVPVPLAPGGAARAGELAGSLGCPPATVLLATWQVLLQRLTGRSGITVGLALPGRRHAELQEVLGPLSRHLPLHSAAPPQASFREVAEQVREAELEAEEWQDFFDWKAVAPPPGASRPPFFPFGFESAVAEEARMAAGVTFTLACEAACTERFQLKLACLRRGDGLEVALRYDAGTVRTGDAVRVAGWVGALLAAAVERPDAPASGLDLLTAEERLQVLVELNATSRDPESGRQATLGALFAAQVRRSPHAPAARFRDMELTYAELDARAEGVARALRRQGVGPEVPVALCVERSLEMLVGLLGIVKASGAWVPLDPGHPAERLAVLLEDSRAAILLAAASLRERLPALSIPVMDPGAMGEGSGPLPPGAVPESLAYILFTSGSTGRPKGVMVPHRAIVNRLLWMQRTFPLEAGDRVLQKTPLVFDASIWEIFSPLLAGACVVLAEPGGHQDTRSLLEAVARHGITTLQLVPSLCAVFVEEDGVDVACRGLQRLFCGGEALPAELAGRCRERLAASLCNLYGPTEAAIDATFCPCGDERGRQGIVPIGRPLDNVRIYLLDAGGLPVPPALPGELHIGGIGLARGYRQRPDLTAERFLPDPFGGPGERLYRSGDLARLLPNGEIEFLGRVDRQVKVRGVRIEPEEIEAILAQHRAVREAAVAAWGEGPADRSLVAWVVLDPAAAPPSDRDLASFLAARLPEPMVPSVFAWLAELPRLPSGKLDRQALPLPEFAPRAERRAGEGPRGPAEEILAGLWSELLGIAAVGRECDFFAAGGHSLLATQLASRVRELFRIEVRVRDLFEAPTVAALAARIGALREAGGGPVVLPLEPQPRDRPFPLSFAQQRLWFLDRLEPGSAAYNLVSAVRLRGRLDVGAFVRALAEIGRRHEALRTVIADHQGEPVQVVRPPQPPDLPQIDLSALPAAAREGEAARAAARVAREPFDLAHGPLARAVLIRLEPDLHIAVFALHHIVADGWSMGVLVRELSALYTACRAGEPSPLPDLRIQYADYAAWQRSWMTGPVLERELAYWREHLRGTPPLLELPTDRPRSALRGAPGTPLPVAIPAALANALRAIGRREGATLFMLLLAAFDALLARLADSDNVVVGSPIAGRNHFGTEEVIGFFVNTLALHTDLAGDPDLRSLLARVRRITLDAFAHQDLPFEKLVEELAPARSLVHAPVFQVMLVVQNTPQAVPALPGIVVEPVRIDEGAARFDLTLVLAEAGAGVEGCLEHDRHLFDAVTAESFARRFESLLAALASDPGTRVSELPLLSASELHEILRADDRTGALGDVEACIHDLIAIQAELHPGRIAVSAPERTLTFADLLARSGLLAGELARRGVGPEVPVAVCLEADDMVVGILAIVRSGGAYLPLDPSYPRERLAFMLEDAGAPLLLTAPQLAPALPQRAGTELLVLGPEWAAELAGEENAPLPRAVPDNLAYIIYTSGSTGRPKGVQVSHRSLVGSVRARLLQYEGRRIDTFLLLSSYAFDSSVAGLFGTLARGAAVVLPPEEFRTEPARLPAFLAQQGISSFWTFPSLYALLLEELDPADLGALTTVILAGEACPPALIEYHRRLLPRADVFNEYGPTEATVWCTVHECGDESGSRVPIGRPIAGHRIYLLDRRLLPVPPGLPGEICVGGVGVARGYRHRPDLTAERFVPDPLGGRLGERLYRTGDLARRNRQGEIEFLGRIDHQVKVRGVRIELGEVEAALERHPAVRRAAVAAQDDGRREVRLVAYVEPATQPFPAAAELRSWLEGALLEAMIPSLFVPMETLPLSPGGKVDRRVLPSPGSLQAHGRKVPPRTLTEERLAEIWASVLGTGPVGALDDFFEVGGNSLIAVRVVARIWSDFGVRIPVRELFASPVLESLATRIEEALLDASGAEELGRLFELLEAGGEDLDEEELRRRLAPTS